MRYDVAKLRTTVLHYLSIYNLDLTTEFQEEFITNLATTLDKIHAGYESELMFEKLTGHTVLLALLRQIENRRIKAYCEELGAEKIEDHIYNSIYQAFTELGDAARELDAFAIPFFKNNIESWSQRLVLSLSKEDLDLSDEFHTLTLFIADKFSKHMVLLSSEDIYSKLNDLLDKSFNSLLDHIKTATDTASFKKDLLEFCPPLYRHKPIPQFDITYIETHPENFMQRIGQDFYMVVQQSISPQLINQLTSELIVRLTTHHNRLSILNADSNKLLVNFAIRENFQLQAKANLGMMHNATIVAKAFVTDWLSRGFYASKSEVISKYNNNWLEKRAAIQIHEALVQKLKPYFVLPNFTAEASTLSSPRCALGT